MNRIHTTHNFLKTLMQFLFMIKFNFIDAKENDYSVTFIMQRKLSTKTSLLLPAFPDSVTNSEILITITNRNFDQLYGYTTNLVGINYYKNNNLLVAGRRYHGNCDSKLIFVTQTVDEDLI